MKGFKSSRIRKANIAGMIVILAAALLTSFFSIGTTLDRELRNLRFHSEEKSYSGEMVFIAIDEKSLKELGNYPWKRSVHGELINKLQGAGVEKLGFDIGFIGEGSYPEANDVLADAISKSDFRVGIAVPGNDAGAGPDGNKVEGMWPLDKLMESGAETFSIWADTNEKGQLEYGNPQVNVDEGQLISFAAWLAERKDRQPYIIDWSYNPMAIKTYSFADVVAGQFNKKEFKGKTIVVGPDASIFNDRAPTTHGQHVTGSRAHIISAETLKTRDGTMISGVFLIIITALLCTVLIQERSPFRKYGYLVATALVLISYQWQNESIHAITTPVGGSLVIVIVTAVLVLAIEAMGFYLNRIMHYEGTGIPNLIAMRMSAEKKGATICIRINNSLEILNEMGEAGRNAIMLNLAQMLEKETSGRQIYQINDSTFAWKTDNHSEETNWGISSILGLFRKGIVHEEGVVDLYVTIGIEADEKLSIEKSVINAMISAERAQARGVDWEVYEKSESDEKWKIGIVSELNKAIDEGHIWVAYQPKVASGTNRITGAEALVRWQHPEKGNIRPDVFIPLLEKANRTEELTHFILNRAISDFSKLPEGAVAVNVSPTMIGNGVLLQMISEAIKRHGYEPSRLTIEVTESEKFSRQEAIDELTKIHAMGVNISIDDYGMGNSTVNYLRIIPASELKIDRSFIVNVLQNRTDRMVVASTIHLAHEMGLKVVAEGVESEEIQKYLSELKCDFIQGYHTGKPVTFDEYENAARISARLAA